MEKGFDIICSENKSKKGLFNLVYSIDKEKLTSIESKVKIIITNKNIKNISAKIVINVCIIYYAYTVRVNNVFSKNSSM